MHLCAEPGAVEKEGLVHAVLDGIDCSNWGWVDYVGPMTGYPPLTLDQINELFVASMILWATCFMLRVIRRMIPKGIG